MKKQEWRVLEGVKWWNMFSAVVFLVVAYEMTGILLNEGLSLYSLSSFDIIVMTLATFRIIRLFVYDNITLLFREWSMDLFVNGEEYMFVPSQNAFKRTVSKLLNCPWCFGVWAALFVVFLYVKFPEWNMFFLVLAIAGVASVIQIFSNMLGWIAEDRKKRVEE